MKKKRRYRRIWQIALRGMILFILSGETAWSQDHSSSSGQPVGHPVSQALPPAHLPNDWENPQLVSQNTMPAHAHFVAYTNEQDALQEKASSNRQSLDGEWKFNLAVNPSVRPLEFYKDDYNTDGWKKIKVPANWQVEGWDQFIFTDVEYPIPPNPPFVPADDNPVGSYKRSFTLPGAWAGKKIIIHFGAVNSFFYLWINGKKAGFSKDSKTPAEFDITGYIRKGENTVSAQVFRFSDGTYLEGQDMWKLSGIERSVWLEARPEESVYDYFIKAGLSDDYQDGLLDMTVLLNGPSFGKRAEKKQSLANVPASGGIGGQIEIKLLDDRQANKEIYREKKKISFGKESQATPQANPHATPQATSKGCINVNSDTYSKFDFHTVIPKVRSWNAEHPNLYTLVINHLDKKGRLIESIVQRIGFRKVEIRRGLFLVNGVAIKIKGVNRHEHDMINGKVITPESMLNDIRLFKQYNINAMRTSHYPNGEDWYSFCDKFGIYLIDEVNLECDGMSMVPSINTLSDKPDWKAAYLDRTRRMWERDKNHCSIITWSLGNESRFGDNFVATYEWLKSKDNTRPVQYEEARDNAYTDIICPMYKSLNVMQEYVKEWRPRPFIQVEYAHMMGNSGGNLKDDWDLIYKYPQLQGGFIWDFCDQAFKRTDKNGRSIWAYGRDMGKVGNTSDTSFCADGMFAADRTPHPQAFELRKVYQNIGFEAVGLAGSRIRIINHFDFTNLRSFHLSWTIKADGVVVTRGEIPETDLAPHQEKEIQIAIPAFAQKPATEYFLMIEARTPTVGTSPANADFGHSNAPNTNLVPNLLPENYVVAWQQFKWEQPILEATNLPGVNVLTGTTAQDQSSRAATLLPTAAASPAAMPLSILKSTSDTQTLRLFTDSFAVSFNKQTGWLQTYVFKGASILKDPLQPHFWRAATDNDIGNSMQMRCAVWQHALEGARLDSFTVNSRGDGRTEIRTEHYLPAVDAKYNMQYIICGNGDIQVNAFMKAGKKELAELPRFGMKMMLNPSFDKVTWLGRGPFDNYWDRQEAAAVDIYSMPADSLFHPYARAQESGYRTDVRWMALRNNKGLGLMVVGRREFSAGVLHFNMARLDFDRNADHNNHGGSMSNEDLIWWNIDYRQMGLGGDNSWGAKTHSEYTLPYGDYRYSFIIRPVDSRDNLPEKAKPENQTLPSQESSSPPGRQSPSRQDQPQQDQPRQDQPQQDQTRQDQTQVAQRSQYPDVLNIRNYITDSGEAGKNVFSDLGAWQAYALPERKEDYGAFIGPLLMDMEGQWLANDFFKLRITEQGKILDLAAAKADLHYYPGLLQQEYILEDLKVLLQLILVSDRTALLRTRISNMSKTKRTLQLQWTGKSLLSTTKSEISSNQMEIRFSNNKHMLRVRFETGSQGQGGNIAISHALSANLAASSDGENSTPTKEVQTEYYQAILKNIVIAPGAKTDIIQSQEYYLREGEIPASRPLYHFEAELKKNKKRWNAYLANYFQKAAPQKKVYRDLAVKSISTLITNWRSAAGDILHDGVFPSISYQGFYGIWSWDSWKQAVALSYFHPVLAKNNIRSMFDYQEKGGMVVDCIYTDKKENNRRDTKPPLAAWAVWKVVEQTKDTAFAREMYPKLVNYHRWWYKDRDHDGNGLCEYGSTDGTRIAAAWESGMDNAVRFDSAVMLKNREGAWSLNQESVDLNAYLYAEKLYLQKLAGALHKGEEATAWGKGMNGLGQLINEQFFDTARGYYYDRLFNKKERIAIEGTEGWIPLWAGIADSGHASAVKSMMENSKKFNTKVPLPTFAADHPQFDPGNGYWRGPVWLDQFYFGIEGLKRYGYGQWAEELKDRLFIGAEGMLDDGPIRENYHPLTGKGLNAVNFSWSAAHILMLLRE